MPVMNGLEATRRIREHEGDIEPTGSERTIIIALTASVFDDAREEIMASGFDDFMRKPFTVAELFECVAKHLNIQYTYRTSLEADARTKTAESEIELTSGDLQGLPEEWIEKMRQAALRGRLRQMQVLIDEIRKSHSRLADLLTSLAYEAGRPAR